MDLETEISETLKDDYWLVFDITYYQISKYVAKLHYLGYCGIVMKTEK